MRWSPFGSRGGYFGSGPEPVARHRAPSPAATPPLDMQDNPTARETSWALMRAQGAPGLPERQGPLSPSEHERRMYERGSEMHRAFDTLNSAERQRFNASIPDMSMAELAQEHPETARQLWATRTV